MLADDAAKGKSVEGEHSGAENRPLGDSTSDSECLRFCSSQGDIFCSSRQVGLEPAQGGVRESDGVVEALKEDVMVNRIENCRQIQKDEERW